MLTEHAAFYLACFADLSAARQVGMNGPQRIAVADMCAYCAMFDIDDREAFFRNIRAADDVYLTWVEKQRPEK